MSTTGWWDYVVRISGTTVQKEIATATGISETAFSRWKRGNNSPEAPHVISFARSYGRPAVEALVAAGILAETDAAAVIEIQRDLAKLEDDELLAEVRRRMTRPKERSGTVTTLRSTTPPPVEEADAASRGPKQSDDDTDDFDPR